MLMCSEDVIVWDVELAYLDTDDEDQTLTEEEDSEDDTHTVHCHQVLRPVDTWLPATMKNKN